MARDKGLLPISANFEPAAASPFDARAKVPELSDLYLEATWENYAYKGMIVSVTDDANPDNNGIWTLKGDDYAIPANWEMAGSGGDTPSTGGGASGQDLYLTTIASDVSGYFKLSYDYQPTETDIANTVTSAEGRKLISTYLFDNPLGVDQIQNGTHLAKMYASLSSTVGSTNFSYTIFLRATDTTETNLFSFDDTDINSTSFVEKVAQSTQGIFPCDTTCRYGVKVYIETTTVPAKTVTYKVGGVNSAYIQTPLVIRHDETRDINQAGSGIEHGHINDGAQDIYGAKNFKNAIQIADSNPINAIETVISDSVNAIPTSGAVKDLIRASASGGFSCSFAETGVGTGIYTVGNLVGFTSGTAVAVGDELTITLAHESGDIKASPVIYDYNGVLKATGGNLTSVTATANSVVIVLDITGEDLTTAWTLNYGISGGSVADAMVVEEKSADFTAHDGYIYKLLPGVSKVTLPATGSSNIEFVNRTGTSVEIGEYGIIESGEVDKIAWDGVNWYSVYDIIEFSIVGGRLYSTEFTTNKVCEYDPETLTPLNSATAPGIQPQGIGGVKDRLFMCDYGVDKVYELDPDTLVELNQANAPGGSPLAIGGTSQPELLRLGDVLTDLIYELDLSTLTPVNSYAATSDDVNGLGGTANRGFIQDRDFFYEIDPTGNTIINSRSYPGRVFRGMGGTNTKVFSCDSVTGDIYRVNPDTLLIEATAPSLDGNPRGAGGTKTI